RFARSPLNGVVPDYLGQLSTTALQGSRLGVRSGDMNAGNVRFDEAVGVLKARGATIVNIPDPEDADTLTAEVELGAIFNEFKNSLNHYLAEQAGDATPVHTLTDIINFNNQHKDKVKYGQTLLIASNAQSGFDQDPVELTARTAAITLAQHFIDD